MRSTLAPRRLAAPTRRASAVAPLAAKPTKAAEFRGLDDAAIDAAVAESKRALFDMRIAQRTRQVRGWEEGGNAWRRELFFFS